MNFPPTLVKPTSTYFNAIYGMIHSSLILYTACIDIYDAILIFILESGLLWCQTLNGLTHST